MEQTFIEDTRIPVTLVKVGPCVVTQVKSSEKDGYWAVQLGFGNKKTTSITKPQLGHLKDAIKDTKVAPRFLREVKLSKDPELKVGQEINISDVFKKGDLVSVTGISKGKGFAGVVKRWGFAGGPRTHGQSDRLRAPGSIGQGTTPGRVHKGKKMAGRMGAERVTVKNLVVVEVDAEKNELKLSGPIPGGLGGLIMINKIGSGKLAELVEETPQPQIVEGESKENEEKNSDKLEETSGENKEEKKE